MSAEDHFTAMLIDPASVSEADRDPLGSVLVIDDDDDVRRIFVEALEEYGYRVHEAANGPAALHMLEQGMSVDVAVVDFAMPSMNGAALARIAQGLRPGLAIVFATGDPDRAAFDAVPGATILRKPLRIVELVDAVRHTFLLGGT
jgi:CheY-like chemotaxis protein